ncbi:MAG: hypothetical protein ACJ79L_07105 [Anaeromyxobacteraceae bacterium]
MSDQREPGSLERARAVARQLAALEEGAMRTGAAARALAAAAPADAALLLAAAVALAVEGDPTLATAFGHALLAPGALAYDHLAAIYAAAVEGGLEEARALLVAAPPRRAWHDRKPAPDRALAGVTLGHQKALARGARDPDLLARLAAGGEPDVVRELVRNPRLTEAQAVRIAARRPCRPETLRAVAAHERWRRAPAVLRAVAQNPYAEPALATKLLPRLTAADLASIADDGTLHPLVRAAAARLVQMKKRRGREALRGGSAQGEEER